MIEVSRSDFETELRRWFQADDLSQTEVDRLYGSWQERAKSWPYIHWLRDQFDPANCAADGRAWWEERQRGVSRRTVLPITNVDLAKMWLNCDPRAHSPRARPWCPDILAGRWREVGVRDDIREERTAPALARELTLHRDGRMQMDGDSRYQGWTWKAHRSGEDYYVYVGPDGEPLPRRWPVYHLEGDEMEFLSSERPRIVLWRRIPG
jgi:hypothetical protein